MRARAPGEEGADPGGRLVHLRLRPPSPRGGAAGGQNGSATPRLSRSPALPLFSGGGSRGRDGAAHSGGFSAPGLGCCVSGGGGSGGGSSPTRAVTIVRGGRRSRAELLSSRRQPWPSSFTPPAPGALRRQQPGFSALRLRAARPSPVRARVCAPSRSLTIAPPGGTRAASGTRVGDTRLPQPTQPGSRRYGDACHADICTRTVTRTILTHVRSHTPQTPGATRAHTHTYLPGPRGRIGEADP